MEEQKRRAEADKLAAITALEQRSREFMREKEEKRRLEARIANMQSQLLIGGNKLEDTPVFRHIPPSPALARNTSSLSFWEEICMQYPQHSFWNWWLSKLTLN